MRTIYLDLCCLNRPFDDQHQPRVRLEAEAVLGLVQWVKLGEVTLIGSEVLDLECSRAPDADRRRKVEAFAIERLGNRTRWRYGSRIPQNGTRRLLHHERRSGTH